MTHTLRLARHMGGFYCFRSCKLYSVCKNYIGKISDFDTPQPQSVRVALKLNLDLFLLLLIKTKEK
ncbi:MAG: hypothetical protein IKB14_01185, partial [Rikenellaceae bacterium]|nr:hypothetical protein [Rikenellaceae bacterium]